MIRIYNTLSKTSEEFIPLHHRKVNMYVCGATTYNDIHIGNARPIVFFDVVRNYLEYSGYKTLYVSNLTDVDDKIIKRAILEKKSENEIAEKYIKNLLEVSHKLIGRLPDMLPRATEYIKDMVLYISELIDLGYAYKNDTGVYFRVNKIADYGILSNQELEYLDDGVRIDNNESKENPKDFSLWKNTSEGITFTSPFGNGRPGWHTECAVMNKVIFKGEIDIHGGGVDLKFPHHENEIAQTEAIDHHHLSKYWMHVGHLNMNNTKMSKSLGNVIYMKDLLDEYDPKAFILLLLSSNYKQPINFNNDLMVQFSKEYDKILRTVKKVFFTTRDLEKNTNISKSVYIEKFETEMNDDFNTPNALSVVYEIIKEMNKTKDIVILNSLFMDLKEMLNVLDLMPELSIKQSDVEYYDKWIQARDEKDYEKADRYRKLLAEKGLI